MAEIFNADQVIGKTLWAQTRVNVRKLPAIDAPVLSVTNPGDRVGIVYSYVTRNGKTWWQIDNEKGPWVQHNSGWFSIKALKEQGAKNIQEEIKAKEEQEKKDNDPFGGLFSSDGTLGKIGKGILLIGAVFVGFTIFDRLTANKK